MNKRRRFKAKRVRRGQMLLRRMTAFNYEEAAIFDAQVAGADSGTCDARLRANARNMQRVERALDKHAVLARLEGWL